MTHDHGPGEEPRSAEAAPGPSAEATVVVEIGGSVGAAVIETGGELDGAEIEIRPAGGRWQGAHTAVRRRQVPGGDRFAAVFGSLEAGHYELRLVGEADERPALRLEVEGGRVARARWPAPGGRAFDPRDAGFAGGLPGYR